MSSEPGSSETVVLEIDFDNRIVTVIPQSSQTPYIYNLDDPDIQSMINRLTAADAQYTVYSQGEVLTKEEYEELRLFYE